MKLIESKAELLPWEPGIEGVYKAIERAGRTCYKSEDKITEDSAKGFVDRMIASKHTAMLEHGTVYLFFPQDVEYEVFEKYVKDKFSFTFAVLVLKPRGFYVTTNLRVLQENNWLDDLKYLCDSTKFHEKRYTFKFTCSRAIANELVRHRVFSFAQESQRYCNYSKDKFDNEITFIAPTWYDGTKKACFDNPKSIIDAALYFQDTISWMFEKSCKKAEEYYMSMLAEKATAQQARDVLPNATKTEVVMTGYESDWRYLFDLRLFGKTGAPHPDMVDLMEKAAVEAKKNGIWDDIMKYPSKFE